MAGLFFASGETNFPPRSVGPPGRGARQRPLPPRPPPPQQWRVRLLHLVNPFFRPARWPPPAAWPASVRSHDARTQRQDSVLRRQFPKNPDETQCDMALASSFPASRAAAGTHARRRTANKDVRADRSDHAGDSALGHCGLAPLNGLAHLEAFELRMIEVERLVLAGILVDSAERLRLGPGFERRLARPDRVRGIQREVVVLGALEQVEFNEARDLGQLRIAVEPHVLEGLLRSFLHAKAIHGDEHHCFSCRPANIAVIPTAARSATGLPGPTLAQSDDDASWWVLIRRTASDR